MADNAVRDLWIAGKEEGSYCVLAGRSDAA